MSRKKIESAALPGKKEWGSPVENDLDAGYAYSNFFGKSLVEAEQMFQANALHFQEDLGAMPAIPFNFYVMAFITYITSDSAEGDADGASAFLRMTHWQIKHRSDLIATGVVTALLIACASVAHRQNFYAADPDIYGDFPERYKAIVSVSEAQSHNK
jgi:hypothetical protein